MPTRTKARPRPAKRRTSVVVGRPIGSRHRREMKPVKRDVRRNGHAIEKTVPFPEIKIPGPGHGFVKALRYLDTLTDFERLRIVRYNSNNFDLDRMRTLLKRLGNPHTAFKSIHVAGTKGKGSTCAMIASMLQACGYKVGLYTSPHLIDIRERICVGGEMIPYAEFGRLIRLIEPIAARMRPTPTYFDVLTAAAFKYFADQKVDIAIIET